MERDPIRLAILLSGTGRTLLNLHERIVDGSLNARIHVVVSSRANALGMEHAKRLDLATCVVERKRLTDETFQARITKAVSGAELVCMAGFLSLWRIPDNWLGRVINIHPALLPDFGGRGMYGRRVHEAVIAAGREESGCTVHFCDNEYDHGRIILQRKVRMLPDDTADALAARVFEQECLAYVDAIRMISDGRCV